MCSKATESVMLADIPNGVIMVTAVPGCSFVLYPVSTGRGEGESVLNERKPLHENSKYSEC